MPDGLEPARIDLVHALRVEVGQRDDALAVEGEGRPVLHSRSPERVGYPTQKPRALMERIIDATSKRGDIVLDAFCGCGTTLVAAAALKRKWIGIDISPTACRVVADRLRRDLNLVEGRDFHVRSSGARAREAAELRPRRSALGSQRREGHRAGQVRTLGPELSALRRERENAYHPRAFGGAEGAQARAAPLLSDWL